MNILKIVANCCSSCCASICKSLRNCCSSKKKKVLAQGFSHSVDSRVSVLSDMNAVAPYQGGENGDAAGVAGDEKRAAEDQSLGDVKSRADLQNVRGSYNASLQASLPGEILVEVAPVSPKGPANFGSAALAVGSRQNDIEGQYNMRPEGQSNPVVSVEGADQQSEELVAMNKNLNLVRAQLMGNGLVARIRQLSEQDKEIHLSRQHADLNIGWHCSLTVQANLNQVEPSPNAPLTIQFSGSSASPSAAAGSNQSPAGVTRQKKLRRSSLPDPDG